MSRFTESRVTSPDFVAYVHYWTSTHFSSYYAGQFSSRIENNCDVQSAEGHMAYLKKERDIYIYDTPPWG